MELVGWDWWGRDWKEENTRPPSLPNGEESKDASEQQARRASGHMLGHGHRKERKEGGHQLPRAPCGGSDVRSPLRRDTGGSVWLHMTVQPAGAAELLEMVVFEII